MKRRQGFIILSIGTVFFLLFNILLAAVCYQNYLDKMDIIYITMTDELTSEQQLSLIAGLLKGQQRELTAETREYLEQHGYELENFEDIFFRTLIGIIMGLTAGYVGGMLDNLITFITNIFTVIPSFVILILIANSIGQAARGPEVVAVIIGLTAWPWTCRSVRSQVISLRNRDHVNLSKLSGHNLPRIITSDILPYVASYVIMALILQISSGILAEAQLSMLGLGPSASNVTTLGIMMQWATKFSAHTLGAWWAFIPVILSITMITFSMNLMNTGLDQVFNPQLRGD